jgi:sarcosine oxidase subunit alpha
MNKEDEMRLVGFRPKNKGDKLVAGAHFLDKGAKEIIENDLGWMSSVCFSPILDDYIGLGFIKNGNQRMGDIVHAYDKMRHNSLDVKICSPHFVDPEGDRVRG